jgi:hypothetical protein
MNEIDTCPKPYTPFKAAGDLKRALRVVYT